MHEYSSQKMRNCWEIVSTIVIFFFFNETTTTEIYTLSLHDALPISTVADWVFRCTGGTGTGTPTWTRRCRRWLRPEDRKSTRLNSSHANISYAVFCLKKK